VPGSSYTYLVGTGSLGYCIAGFTLASHIVALAGKLRMSHHETHPLPAKGPQVFLLASTTTVIASAPTVTTHHHC
jgi:hypothetical protein